MKVKHIILLAYLTFVAVGLFNAYTTISNKDHSSAHQFSYSKQRSVLQDNTKFTCERNRDCGNGTCFDDEGEKYCVCDGNYINYEGGVCNYHQVDKLTMFLVSFFVGPLGVDWFLSAVPGSAQFGGYIAAGVFKLLTCGGLFIWWIAGAYSRRPLLTITNHLLQIGFAFLLVLSLTLLVCLWALPTGKLNFTEAFCLF